MTLKTNRNTCPNCLSELTDDKQKVLCKKCGAKKCIFCNCACQMREANRGKRIY